jgi:hypothetical protein
VCVKLRFSKIVEAQHLATMTRLQCNLRKAAKDASQETKVGLNATFETKSFFARLHRPLFLCSLLSELELIKDDFGEKGRKLSSSLANSE